MYLTWAADTFDSIDWWDSVGLIIIMLVMFCIIIFHGVDWVEQQGIFYKHPLYIVKAKADKHCQHVIGFTADEYDILYYQCTKCGANSANGTLKIRYERVARLLNKKEQPYE